MNPRYRRLLIPGLLIALLVIVIASSLVDRADGAEGSPVEVSRIDDPRVTESSGLVVSRSVEDLAYTINDSGNAPILFAVRISTGAVVGTTTLGTELIDAEALSIDRDGTIWIADTGDNRGQRTDAALLALPEPGAGNTIVTSVAHYPLTYPDGPRDVEALAIDPGSGRKLLLTKGLLGGEVYAVPDQPVVGTPNAVTAVDATAPGIVTDAAFTPDGRYVVARDYGAAHVLDAKTYTQVARLPLPDSEQGETLAMEATGRSFLIGSEGKGSALVRVPFTEPTQSTATARPTVTTAAPDRTGSGETGEGNGFAGATWFWAAAVMALLATICVAATRRR
ncbi:MAG: hypothetical protein JWR27_878 [Aeromicrobium sp.]|nr:hypothetical protein [Aeromicrobium sp.]